MILCGHQKWCYNKLECQRSSQQRPPVTFVIRPTSLPLFNHPGQWGPLGPHQGTLYVSLLAYKRRSVPKYPGRKRWSVHVPANNDHLLIDNDVVDHPHAHLPLLGLLALFLFNSFENIFSAIVRCGIRPHNMQITQTKFKIYLNRDTMVTIMTRNPKVFWDLDTAVSTQTVGKFLTSPICQLWILSIKYFLLSYQQCLEKDS